MLYITVAVPPYLGPYSKIGYCDTTTCVVVCPECPRPLLTRGTRDEQKLKFETKKHLHMIFMDIRTQHIRSNGRKKVPRMTKTEI